MVNGTKNPISFLVKKHYKILMNNEEKKTCLRNLYCHVPDIAMLKIVKGLNNFDVLRKMRSTLILSLFLMTIATVHGIYDLGRLKKLLQRKSLNVKSSEQT